MAVSTAFLVTVDGNPLPATLEGLLVSAVVDDSLRLPDLFSLRFRDPNRNLLDASGIKVGSLLTVSVMPADSQSPQALISGEVTALEAEFDAVGTFTVVRGYDHAHRLFRGRRTETYTQVTASDVVTTVARRAGLKVGKVDTTNVVYDHLAQAGLNDWEFLNGLAREIGYEILVHDGAVDFGKPSPAPTAPSAGGPAGNPLVLEQGKDLLRFRSVVTSAEQVKEVEVRGWDVDNKTKITSTHPATTQSAQLNGATPADLAHTFGDPVYVSTDVPYRVQAEVDGAAAALAEQIAGAFAEFEGVARGNPKLRAGTAISIQNLGTPFDGKYTITTSRHRYEPDSGYTTSFAVTGRQERSLYGLTGGSAMSARGVPGVVIGQVSDIKDPQKLGRVKLTFPWLSDDYVSDWARTVQPGAGKDRGALVLPEVGDEVLVAFEQDDVRQPYVIGGLYNGVDKPKAGKSDAVSGSGTVICRSFVSRRGHRIDVLDDDGRTEGISMTSSDDSLRLVIDAVKTTVTVHSDGSVTIEGKNGVVVDAGSAKLDLKGTQIALSAQSGITIDGGGGAVSVQTGSDLTLKGTSATLQGSSQTTVSGGALCTVTAGLVKINS